MIVTGDICREKAWFLVREAGEYFQLCLHRSLLVQNCFSFGAEADVLP